MKHRAYGKINLGLVVNGKLPNGYHELKMVTVPVDLFDVLTINKSESIQIQSNKWFIANDESNTLYKTLMVMHRLYGIDPNYSIQLKKNIPTQAGMGGGSADAATLIHVLDEQLHLHLTDQQKLEVGLQVGADVPFCLYNKPAIVEGIGEIITPLTINCPFHLFLVKPKFGINTGSLFRSLAVHERSIDQIDKLIEGLTTNNYSLVADNLVNDLQNQAIASHPPLKKIIDELKSFGFDNAIMTGAGSVVFAITQDEKLCTKAVETYHTQYPLVKKSRIMFDL